MKKIRNYLLLLVSLMGLAVALPSQAATWANPLFPATSYTNLYAGGGLINTISLTSTGAATTVTLFDAPATNWYAISAWTNATLTSVTYTEIYTNRMASRYTNGVIEPVTITNTYTAVTNAISVVNGVTNLYPVIGTWYVPSNSTVSLSFTKNNFLRGLYLTNTGGGNFSINYSPTR